MLRVTTLAAGLAAAGLAVAAPSAQAAPLPALNAAQVGGGAATVETVGWRRGYYGGGYGYRGYGGGYGYRRRGIGAGGALAAGAALGLIGGALAASAAPRYGYYDRPYYGGYGYGGYARPVYGYGGYGPGYGYYGY